MFFGYLLQKHLDKTEEEEEQVDLKYFLKIDSRNVAMWPSQLFTCIILGPRVF